jgi:hypothetical protein
MLCNHCLRTCVRSRFRDDTKCGKKLLVQTAIRVTAMVDVVRDQLADDAPKAIFF